MSVAGELGKTIKNVVSSRPEPKNPTTPVGRFTDGIVTTGVQLVKEPFRLGGELLLKPTARAVTSMAKEGALFALRHTRNVVMNLPIWPVWNPASRTEADRVALTRDALPSPPVVRGPNPTGGSAGA